jgi:ketosteroid isomerase-like protein
MQPVSVEIVRDAYRAWNAGDWAALMSLADPHFELRPVLGTPENTVFYGLEGAKAYRAAAEDLLGRLTADIVEVLRADDEHVVVLSHVQGRGAETGIEVDQHFVYLFTLDAGRVTALQSFATEGDAVASLGAEAPPAVAPTPARPSPGGALPPRGEAARARPGA